jgi:hypothetical protein
MGMVLEAFIKFKRFLIKTLKTLFRIESFSNDQSCKYQKLGQTNSVLLKLKSVTLISKPSTT